MSSYLCHGVISVWGNCDKCKIMKNPKFTSIKFCKFTVGFALWSCELLIPKWYGDLQWIRWSITKKSLKYWKLFQQYNQNIFCLLVPYRLAGGTLSLLAVCPSVSQSITHQFSRLFSAVFWDLDLKFGILILVCLHVIQIKCDFCHVWHTFT